MGGWQCRIAQLKLTCEMTPTGVEMLLMRPFIHSKDPSQGGMLKVSLVQMIEKTGHSSIDCDSKNASASTDDDGEPAWPTK